MSPISTALLDRVTYPVDLRNFPPEQLRQQLQAVVHRAAASQPAPAPGWSSFPRARCTPLAS